LLAELAQKLAQELCFALFPFQPVFKPMTIGQLGQPSLICVAFRPDRRRPLQDGLARLVKTFKAAPASSTFSCRKGRS
jgi:hypothetical protein